LRRKKGIIGYAAYEDGDVEDGAGAGAIKAEQSIASTMAAWG
jgi:hypothetical protein